MQTTTSNPFKFANHEFQTTRPHTFGLVIEGPPANATPEQADYLHNIFLDPGNRDAFFKLIDTEGLIICKQLNTDATTYRKVRGKSSHHKLSQAEYYHHDGCSTPVKPRVVEIRLPYQAIERNVHTAVARLPGIIKAMLTALPDRLKSHADIAPHVEAFNVDEESDFPPVETWDKIQGKVTRLVRKDFDAESCRSYFRDVDALADAYVLPWEMGESRLMVNNHADISKTMQHRRAYQKARETNEQNGSLVKRWTAEET